MAATANNKTFIDRLAGDKVVWIIMLSLCLISFVSIFSSTSQMATEHMSRLDIVYGQIKTILGGLGCVLICCYVLKDMGIYRFFAKLGFLVSVVLLLLLDLKVDFGFIAAKPINTVWRVLKVGGLQIHVFEIVKVAMVMYLAWAIEAVKLHNLSLLNKLAEVEKLSFLQSEFWQEMVCIFLPMVIVCVLILPGGNSSAIFLAGIMFLTVMVGGVNFKHLLVLALVGVISLGTCLGLYQITKNTDKPMLAHLGTAVSRITDKSIDYVQIYRESDSQVERQKALDKIRQPYGAQIAVKEGGIKGKGPGNSTQKYVVPVIYEDYIFSFIVEEYGLFGGIFVIILYISLLARASIIVRNCDQYFSKVAVAGLCLLITGQGMFHILINCGVGVLTGQTLPLVSHGTSSFLCFSIAFGIILSMSRNAVHSIETEEKKSEPLVDTTIRDDIKDGFVALNGYESEDEFGKDGDF